MPGVFLARAGWAGRPEVVHYAGQGASSVELYWDGFALDPIGRDSAGMDLSQISLGLLQRVEVEVLPTVLRVYLFSDGQPVRHARTETSFSTGDASTNAYRIRYLNRWKDGTGLGVGVEFLGTAAARADDGHSNSLTLWGKGSWVPSPRIGIEYQAVSTSLDRDGFQVTSAGGSQFTIGNPDSHRTDLFLRGFVASRDDGMGLRFDALAGQHQLHRFLLGPEPRRAAGRRHPRLPRAALVERADHAGARHRHAVRDPVARRGVAVRAG